MFILGTLALRTQPNDSFDDEEEIDARECCQAVPDGTEVMSSSCVVMVVVMASQCLRTINTSPMLLVGLHRI